MINRESTSLQNRQIKNLLNADVAPEADATGRFTSLKKILDRLKSAKVYQFSYIDQDEVDPLFEKVLSEAKGKFTPQMESVINILLLLSLNRSTVSWVKNYLNIIAEKFSNSDEAEFKSFISCLTKNLTPSQVIKLEKAFLPNKNKSSKEEEITFVKNIIDLYTSHFVISPAVSENDSTSFFAVDNHIKEAICWQKLEFSKSGDEDLSRLAGTIASKVWLFKAPLLRRFCEVKNIDILGLTFSQKANYTKEALEFFPEDEVTKILDGAVERELEKRKKHFKPDRRKKYKNKRTTVGIELEMGLIPYEAIATYAFYESLDRPTVDVNTNGPDPFDDERNIFADQDSRAVVADVFKIKDLESQADICDRNFTMIGDLMRKLENADEILDQDKITKTVKLLVNQMFDQAKKDAFSAYLEQGSEINLEFLKILQKYWQVKALELKVTLTKSRKELTVGIRSRGRQYTRMYELFKYHMNQIRYLGKHGIGSDAYGEYQLDFVKGNLHNTPGIYTREIWDLAEAAFHDMDLDSRPLHLSVGWKELGVHDRDSRPLEQMTKEASLLNFAMFVSGWANREFIVDLTKKTVGRNGHLVESFRDTGRSQLIRQRIGKYDQLEFRGFSPGKHDQPRLIEAMGYLSTAMRGYVAINLNEETKTRKEFSTDRKLHAVWKKFSLGVNKIYKRFDSIPSLYNANDFVDSDYNQRIDNFFKKIVADWDKEDGVSADMRKLIRQTVKEIKKILGD